MARNKDGIVKPLYFGDAPEIVELLEGARKVLKSGNKVAFEALERNIRYFSQAIDDQKELMRLRGVKEQEKKEEAQKEIVNIRLLIPYENIIGTTKKPDIELSAIQPSESFMVYLKTSLFFGLLLTSPWVFYHIWAFISSGLYQKEKKYVHVVVPASATLFITGSVFFLMVVAKMMMGFFVKFDQLLGFTSRWSPQYYLSLVLTLTLVFGAAFQMPIAVIFANLMKLVSIEQLAKARKFVMLGLLFISAVATPPDVISQIALATPLYILYEGSIITCRILRRRREKNAQLA